MPVGDRGYDKGYVSCCDCTYLKPVLKDERIIHYKCLVSPVIKKTDDLRWRRCTSFRGGSGFVVTSP